MSKEIDKRVEDLLPVSNLVWIGAKGDYTIKAEEEQQFLNTFFPKNRLEQFEIDDDDQRRVAKKVAMQFKKWADEERLKDLGLFCRNPIGFANWDGFIDFIRKEPPAFLWKIHPDIAFGIDNILVPIDFSSGTERTIPLLSNIIDRTGARKITLLNLFNYNNPSDDQNSIALSIRGKLEEMEWFLEANLKKEYRSKLTLEAIPRFKEDKALLLDKYIKENDIDLVLLGSHNFSHYHYLLYGSTTAEVLSNESPVQVCVLFK